jgi:hypothetical protein
MAENENQIAIELIKLLIMSLLQAQQVARATDAEIEVMFAEEKAKMLANDPATIPDV